MNIFIVIIMAIMLASYQYFTEKRTSTTTLNKTELQLQAKINCLKQFHDYASGINETIATDTEADIKEEIKYNCLGAEDINVYKYCLNSSGAKIDCSDESINEHCVSSSEWVVFEKKDLYMTTQIPKNGVSILPIDKEKIQIRGKDLIVSKRKPKGEYPTLIGLISCVPAEKIKKLKDAAEIMCEAGQIAVTNEEDGSYECKDMVIGNICTAHENKLDEDNKSGKCTETSDSFCCAKDSSIISCEKGKEAVWNYETRYWICSDGEEYCSAPGEMKVTDDRGTPYSHGENSQISAPAWTPKYDERTKQFFCYPKSDMFTSACKNLAKSNADYAYLNVTGLSTPIEGNKVKNQEYTTPYTCILSYKKNSNAVENCTPCEQVVFDETNNRWTCKAFPTFDSLESIGTTAMEELKNTNKKGIKGCFSDCSSDMWEKIKNRTYNEKNWGLSYDGVSRMWNCFSCNDTTYNSACEATITKSHDCAVQATVSIQNCAGRVFGKCKPKDCSTEYQVLIDDVCYTKWCAKGKLPSTAEINSPTTSCCPPSSPWMLYNEELTCVYCVRPPAQRIE